MNLSLRSLLQRIHEILGKSRFLAKLCVKLRNQANCVVGQYLASGSDLNENGEEVILNHLCNEISYFIDVGANIGKWSVALNRVTGASGLAYEPNEECYGRLLENLKGLPIQAFQCGVGDIETKICFHDPGNCSTRGSFVVPATKAYWVNVIRLETVLQASDVKVDFLKVDTEGYDLHVLRGLGEYMSKIRFIQFEYNSFWSRAGSSLIQAIDLVENHGFKVFLIKGNGLYDFDYSIWGDFYRYSNFLCVQSVELKTINSLLKGYA